MPKGAVAQPRVAVLLDLENLLVSERGQVIDWKNLIEALYGYGNLVTLKCFMSFYSIPGNLSSTEEILAALPYAETIFTMERRTDKDVTDNHMNQVAIAMLADKKASPDILIIGSGDHFFAPIAKLYEKQGKKVVILSNDQLRTARELSHGRETFFLSPKYMFQPKERKICEDEFRMLASMLVWPRPRISKNSPAFQMVSLAYDLAKEKRGISKRDLASELAFRHKRAQGIQPTNHDIDYKYFYAVSLLAGRYNDKKFSSALGQVPGTSGCYFREGSDMGAAIERIQSRKN